VAGRCCGSHLVNANKVPACVVGNVLEGVLLLLLLLLLLLFVAVPVVLVVAFAAAVAVTVAVAVFVAFLTLSRPLFCDHRGHSCCAFKTWRRLP